MKAAVTLEAQAREISNKGAVRELRRNGQVPAILYSKTNKPVALTLIRKDLMREYLKGGLMSRIVELKTAKEVFHAIPRELQLHPVKDRIEHADFIRVEENSRIKVSVPVHFNNQDKCLGIKRGGVLNIVRHAIEVYCTPKTLPTAFEVDLLNLQIGESFHISGLNLPEGVTPAIKDRDFTIATIVGRGGKADQEDDAAAAATPTEGAAAEAKDSKEGKDAKKDGK